MGKFSKYVGLDVHKKTIAVSVAQAGGGEARYVGEIANTLKAVEKLVRQLRKDVSDSPRPFFNPREEESMMGANVDIA